MSALAAIAARDEQCILEDCPCIHITPDTLVRPNLEQCESRYPRPPDHITLKSRGRIGRSVAVRPSAAARSTAHNRAVAGATTDHDPVSIGAGAREVGFV